jgi:hypothetical protein
LAEKKTIKIISEVIIAKYYEVCATVACCFPNILDVLALEHINLSEDEIGGTQL